ncbi:ladderlectin-like [Astyanax mexicanus]|uniref:Ladderlectin-like n=2 Tax=Astyanax mexicanus TaxID=7994 RepID=A0A8T2KYP3_ASTMX|nr:ladderlectin-like [Astyanax mexicanus]
MRNILVLLVIVMVPLAGTASVGRKCEYGWERFGRNCYKYISVEKTWTASEQHCISLGGNLASVHSLQTHNFLKRFSKTKAGKYVRTWIGGHDATENFQWLWSDGTKFDFTAWLTDEPNNAGNAEHCVEMNYGGGVLWNDARCNAALYSVCQKPAAVDYVM